TLVTTGTFSVAGPTGITLHTDAYTLQTFSATVPWATTATATPLADFSAVQLLSRGFSVDFGNSATAYMNRATFNSLRANGNSAALYARRTSGFGTVNNQADINKLFQGDDLPQIQIYDKGYKDDTGTFQLYIPANKCIVVGKRPANVPVGQYCYTRNANNPGWAPRAYTRIIDKGEMAIPREIHVHDGHSGGLKLFYPSAIVVMTV